MLDPNFSVLVAAGKRKRSRGEAFGDEAHTRREHLPVLHVFSGSTVHRYTDVHRSVLLVAVL